MGCFSHAGPQTQASQAAFLFEKSAIMGLCWRVMNRAVSRADTAELNDCHGYTD
jgi:hypothetical protein